MSAVTGKDVYRMPSLGADMESGTLIEWVKQPGEAFKKGDVIAVVETQKGAIEVEVFHDGVLGRLLVEPGQTVPVGTPMAELEPVGSVLAGEPVQAAPSEPKPSPTRAADAGHVPEASTEETRVPAVEQTEEQPTGREPRRPSPTTEILAAPLGQAADRHRASPAARHLAQQLGLSLNDLAGTGPGGAIVLEDVRAAAASQQASSPKPQSSARRGMDLTAMRKAIAAAMSRSKREIPHYYLAHDIDLTTAADWLAQRNAELPPERRLLMGVLFIKAVAVTLRDFPELNGFDRDGRFESVADIHVGSAIAIRGGGLVAPAIHDADRLDLDTLMERLRDLVARVRAGTLRGSELSDPTITVSSLGERGVDRLYGVIYPPQVAIVGFGTPTQRPWVQGEQVVPRLIVTATLAADHRHSDGHRGGLFLARLAKRLQEPENL
jgi:pyruvate dehydrogenase E2 component (dihydrolipoamide acetyltransferase)